jgi:predicted transcriptional regulator
MNNGKIMTTDAIFTITTMEQLKALTDPLRQELLDRFSNEPMTTKQVADLLGQKPHKLYHHVDVLEQAGLIRLVRTQQNRGTVEKYYEAVARRFTVDHKLLSASSQADQAVGEIQAVLVNALQTSLVEAIQFFDDERFQDSGLLPQMAVSQGHLRLSAAQFKELKEQLLEWIEECQTAHDPHGDEYALMLAIFPVKSREKGSDNDQETTE